MECLNTDGVLHDIYDTKSSADWQKQRHINCHLSEETDTEGKQI